MKKNIAIILTLALHICGCAIEETHNKRGSILAIMENDDTRTSVTDEGRCTWSSGDQIWMQTTSGSTTGILTSGEGSAKAQFSYGAFIGEMTGKAIYPDNPGHYISNNTLNVFLPASYDLGSTLENTNAVMYGIKVDDILRFNHLAGVMRFSFKNVPAGTDKFVIGLDKRINGTFTADLTEEYPRIESEESDIDSEKYITLNFKALTETSDIKLYVPLPIGTYSSISLALLKGEESIWTYSNTITNTIARKSLKLMPTVSLGGSIDGGIESGPSQEMIQSLSNKANTNIKAIRDILAALDNKDFATDITPIMEDYKEVGSTIQFYSSLGINIYYGISSYNTPKIGVKKDDTGFYNWTIDGEWLKDNIGNHILVSSIIPQLKIENGYWLLSTDSSKTWTQLGRISDEDGSFIIRSVENNGNFIYLNLTDETIITIPTRQLANSYWSGKKFIINGDSIVYGSGLGSVYDGFSYLVAEHLGMSITNYGIGGSVIARRAKDYDECYTSKEEWEAAMNAGELNTKKKYLVNTGTGAPRIYRIYSYNGSKWVAGGNTSETAGRFPISDRVRAMDTDADVIMIMAGSNDFYYNWTPFGDFESGKYRENLKDIDPETNLLDSDNVELIHKGAPTANGPTIDYSYPAYFTYAKIPVVGGCAIKVPYGRRGWWLDKNGKGISDKNFTLETADYTAIAPYNAAYLTVCFKYEEIDPENCAVYMSVPTDKNAPNETFCDGLHKLCRYLCETYKNKDIIFLTPIKRKQPAGTGSGTWDCIYPEDTNAEGKTLKDYRDKIIEACEYYSIPYIDLYTLSGLNPHIDPSLFADTDGRVVHPNEEGHRRMASIIIGQMQKLRQ